MKKVLAAFAANTVFANIVLLMIFLAGIMAGMSMIRESFPQFSLDLIQIKIAYPGADPEEVEEGVCLKIEEALESVEDGVVNSPPLTLGYVPPDRLNAPLENTLHVV